jgi:hypothetical protein
MQNVALFLAGWLAAAAGLGVLIGKCIALFARSPENAADARVVPFRPPSDRRRS